mgnify:CR=1 FL=1
MERWESVRIMRRNGKRLREGVEIVSRETF